MATLKELTHLSVLERAKACNCENTGKVRDLWETFLAESRLSNKMKLLTEKIVVLPSEFGITWSLCKIKESRDQFTLSETGVPGVRPGAILSLNTHRRHLCWGPTAGADSWEMKHHLSCGEETWASVPSWEILARHSLPWCLNGG